MQKPSILFYSPLHSNSSTYFRAELPAKYLKSYGFPIVCTKQTTMSQIQEFDIIVFQKCITDNDYDLLKYANIHKKITVYDLDDDLANIPDWIGAQAVYKYIGHGVKRFARDSKYFIASTPGIVKRYGNEESKIIRNSVELGKLVRIPFSLRNFYDEEVPETVISKYKYRIGFWGSTSHIKEVEQLTPSLEALASDTNYCFLYVGTPPKYLFEKLRDRMYQIKPVGLENYINLLHSLNLDLVVAPLIDCEFNLSKSNIKLLEAFSIGVPVIASDIGEYRRTLQQCVLEQLPAGYWCSKFDKSWEDTIRSTLPKAKELGSNGYKFVSKHYNIATTHYQYAGFFSSIYTENVNE